MIINSTPDDLHKITRAIVSARWFWTVLLSGLLLIYLQKAGMPVHRFDSVVQASIHGLLLGGLFACVCTVPAKIIASLIRWMLTARGR